MHGRRRDQPTMPDQNSPSQTGPAGQPDSADASGMSAGVVAGSAPRRDWLRVLRKATIARLSVSLAAHAGFMVIALYVVFLGPAGSVEGSGTPVEFAVVSQAELAQMSGELPQPSTPIVPETPPIDVPESMLSETLDAAALATEGYVEWCLSAMQRDDMELWVGRVGSDLAGFVTTHRSKDAIEIVLNGVAPEFQRRGIYGALVAHVMRGATRQNIPRVFSSTQLHNLGPQKVWARRGLEPTKCEVTFHYWSLR